MVTFVFASSRANGHGWYFFWTQQRISVEGLPRHLA